MEIGRSYGSWLWLSTLVYKERPFPAVLHSSVRIGQHCGMSCIIGKVSGLSQRASFHLIFVLFLPLRSYSSISMLRLSVSYYLLMYNFSFLWPSKSLNSYWLLWKLALLSMLIKLLSGSKFFPISQSSHSRNSDYKSESYLVLISLGLQSSSAYLLIIGVLFQKSLTV